MCAPMAAVAVASTAANFFAQKSQADAQREAQALATKQERVRASQEMRNVRLRQGQQRLALANEMDEGARRANVAMATAQTALGEAGVGGRAAELVQQDLNVQNARYQHSLQQQKSENDFASELQLENSRLQSAANQQRINQPIQEPSFFDLGLGLIGAAAGAQTQAAQYEAATGQAPTWGNLIGLNIGGRDATQIGRTTSVVEPVVSTPTFASVPSLSPLPSLSISDAGLPTSGGTASSTLLPSN